MKNWILFYNPMREGESASIEGIFGTFEEAIKAKKALGWEYDIEEIDVVMQPTVECG